MTLSIRKRMRGDSLRTCVYGRYRFVALRVGAGIVRPDRRPGVLVPELWDRGHANFLQIPIPLILHVDATRKYVWSRLSSLRFIHP